MMVLIRDQNPRADIELKPIKKEDEKELQKVVCLRRLFIDRKDPLRHNICPDYYLWLYFQNPVKGSSFWAAYHKDQMMGISTVVAKQVSIFGEKIKIGEDAAGFVHPAYQGRGIRTSLLKANMKTVEKNGIITVFGISRTKQIHRGFKKLNYTNIPALNLKCLIKPVNFKRLLNSTIKSKIFCTVGAFMIRAIYDLLFKKSAPEPPEGISIQKDNFVSSAFDDFYLRCEKDYDVIQVRDSKYLNWRYFKGPDYYDFFSIRKGSGIVGYFVINTTPWRDMKIGNIVDFLTFKGNSRLVESIISRAIFELQKKNVDMEQVWVLKGSPFYRHFLKCGFIPFRNVMVLFNNTELVRSLVEKKPVFHFTAGDSDYL
jgi:GNAT superfamily N-acetyltransferase